MYQQYRLKKQRSFRGAKILGVIVIVAILGFGLRYLSKLGEKVEQQKSGEPIIQTGGITSDWYVGKKVILSGNILPASGSMLAYTNQIQVPGSSELIAVFSSSRDLRSYTGFFYVQGTVAKFDGKQFVVDIDSIGGTLDQLQTMMLPTSTTSTIIPQLALKIDLSNHTDITYSTSGNTIVIQAAGVSGNIVLQGFTCSPSPERDCATIQKSFTEGSFVSAGGMTFTKGSANTRFAYNTAGIGYRVATSSDSLLYKVSTVIIPLNETYVKNLIPSMQKLCVSQGTGGQQTVQQENLSSWKVSLKGCVLRVTFSQAGENIALISGTAATTTTPAGTGKVATTVITPTVPVTTQPSGVAPNTSKVAPLATSGGYTYTSARGGYSIYFPSAKIGYNGVTLQPAETLGVKGLSCYIRLDVKDYKDNATDAVGPAVSIYECTSKESATTLAKALPGYRFQASKDGTKIFFIKTWNAVWADFEKQITIH